MLAVATIMMGSGRQALEDWRRKNADEARGRRSHGGQANHEAEGADQSQQKAAPIFLPSASLGFRSVISPSVTSTAGESPSAPHPRPPAKYMDRTKIRQKFMEGFCRLREPNV
jgi:hypothetical protein